MRLGAAPRKSVSPPDDQISAKLRVVDAALSLFAERGFAGTGIREIAVKAGVSTALLYHYMGTKEDLLLYIMREGLHRFTKAAQLAMADVAGPERMLVCLTRVHVFTEVLQRRMSLVIDNEVRTLSEAGAAQILPLRDDYERLWRRVISAGATTGSFHVADPALARLALIEMCNGVAHWYSEDGPLALETVADRFADMALALLEARRRGRLMSVVTLGMHPPSVEADIVSQSYATFCSQDSAAFFD